MNIAREFEPVGVGIDQDGLVTPTQSCPVFALGAIEVLGIIQPIHMTHDALEIGLGPANRG